MKLLLLYNKSNRKSFSYLEFSEQDNIAIGKRIIHKIGHKILLVLLFFEYYDFHTIHIQAVKCNFEIKLLIH